MQQLILFKLVFRVDLAKERVRAFSVLLVPKFQAYISGDHAKNTGQAGLGFPSSHPKLFPTRDRLSGQIRFSVFRSQGPFKNGFASSQMKANFSKPESCLLDFALLLEHCEVSNAAKSILMETIVQGHVGLTSLFLSNMNEQPSSSQENNSACLEKLNLVPADSFSLISPLPPQAKRPLFQLHGHRLQGSFCQKAFL